MWRPKQGRCAREDDRRDPVDDDHLIRLSGEARQDHAAQVLPPSILIVEINDYTIRCGADCAARVVQLCKKEAARNRAYKAEQHCGLEIKPPWEL
ncbi:hypothetical protein ACVI1J_008948 [Bradyrhizobium diazoefficiens]